MGLPLQDIEALVGAKLDRGSEPGVYTFTSVPKPHHKFKQFRAQLSQKTGLCRLSAATRPISTSAHGLEVRTEFGELESLIGSVYGRSERTDILLPGSIWNEPQDWMMALAKGERALQTAWDRKRGSQMKDGIQSVWLSANAFNGRSDQSWFLLTYTFENFAACESALREEQKAAF